MIASGAFKEAAAACCTVEGDCAEAGPATFDGDGTAAFGCVTGRDSTVGDAPMKVHQAAPDVPTDLADLIDRLVDPDPDFRPGLPGAVAEELRDIIRAALPGPRPAPYTF